MLLPEARGRGDGARAQRLLARYLFAHATAHRIWAWIAVDNILTVRNLLAHHTCEWAQCSRRYPA
jgi:RimJ/RimL family protein N-acetyltransferase